MRRTCLAAVLVLLFGTASAPSLATVGTMDIPSDAPQNPPANPPPSLPADAGPTLDQFKDANSFIREALAEAASGKPVPTLADPVTAEKIRTAFDERILAGLGKNDLIQLIDVCGSPAQTMMLYLYFQTGNPDAASSEQARDAQVARNSIRFQDELALAIKFSIACIALTAPAAETFWLNLPTSERTEARREGMAKVRRGMAQTYAGSVMTQTEPLKPENRQLVLDAVVRNLDVFSASMGLAERQSVIDAVDRALALNVLTKDVRDKLQQVRSAMTRKDCVGLCSY